MKLRIKPILAVIALGAASYCLIYAGTGFATTQISEDKVTPQLQSDQPHANHLASISRPFPFAPGPFIQPMNPPSPAAAASHLAHKPWRLGLQRNLQLSPNDAAIITHAALIMDGYKQLKVGRILPLRNSQNVPVYLVNIVNSKQHRVVKRVIVNASNGHIRPAKPGAFMANGSTP